MGNERNETEVDILEMTDIECVLTQTQGTEFPILDPYKFTDEELGIPPDDYAPD